MCSRIIIFFVESQDNDEDHNLFCGILEKRRNKPLCIKRSSTLLYATHCIVTVTNHSHQLHTIIGNRLWPSALFTIQLDPYIFLL
jgi:hypothetical protein